MNALEEMRKLIADGDVDVLRELVRQMAEALMGAEVDALCGAARAAAGHAGPRPRLSPAAMRRSTYACPRPPTPRICVTAMRVALI